MFLCRKRTWMFLILSLLFMSKLLWVWVDKYYFIVFDDLPCNHSHPLLTVKEKLIFPQLAKFNPKAISKDFGKLRDLDQTTTNVTVKFRSVLTKEEKLMSLFVFQKFINLCEAYKIEFFIYGGTLLGKKIKFNLLSFNFLFNVEYLCSQIF